VAIQELVVGRDFQVFLAGVVFLELVVFQA
jgi:hypothetical protein